MAKNPVFYVLTALLLLCASLVAPSAHAADPAITFYGTNCLGAGWYFHLVCDDSKNECKLSQRYTEDPPSAEDITCWEGVVQNLETTNNKSSKIILDGDLDFGGYDPTSPTNNGCNLQLTAIIGGSHAGFDGQNHTIHGLCYRSNTDDSYFALFEKLEGGTFQNVVFDGVYIEAQFGAVLGYELVDASVSNVTIKDARLNGERMGGLVYRTTVSSDNSIAIENITLENVQYESKDIGTAFNYNESGCFGGISCSVTGGNVSISGVNATSLSIRNSIAPQMPEDVTLGGIAGYFSSNKTSVSNSTIDGSIVSTSGCVGGIVGYAYATDLMINTIGSSIDLSGEKVGGMLGLVDGFGDKHIIVKNTYSLGKIEGNGGYIVGEFSSSGLQLSAKDSLYNNFHYNTEDAVSLGVGNYPSSYGNSWAQGSLYDNNNGTNDVENQGNIFGNVRNEVSGLSANESFGYHFNVLNDLQKNQVASYMDFFEGSRAWGSDAKWPLVRVANGVAKESAMKSALFAALMNYNLESKGQPAVWVSKSGVNDGLPAFAESSDKPNHLVLLETTYLNLTSTQSESLTNKPVSIRDSSNSGDGTYIPYAPIAVKTGLVSYTDENGEMTSDLKTDLGKIIDYVNGNSGATVSIVDGDGNPVTSFDGSFSDVQSWTISVPKDYFCFKENGSLEFRQVKDVDAPPAGEDCFEYWYDDNADHSNGATPDAYSYAQAWLNSNAGTIVLTSDSISFAGKQVLVDNDGNPTDTVCVDAPNAFKGKYLTLSSGDLIQSETGKLDTIKGLCYKSDVTESIGFVYITGGVGIDNVAFSDVYFKLGTDSYKKNAGVLMLERGVSLGSQHITVVNSEFRAYYVGAIAGDIEDCDSIANKTVSNVKVDGVDAGGVVGGMSYTSYYNKTSPTLVSDISVSEVSLNGSYSAGGVISYFGGSTGLEIQSVSVDGNIIGYDNAGGLVSVISLDVGAPLSIQNVKVLGHVSVTKDDVSNMPSLGGLVGVAFFDENTSVSNLTIKNTFSKGRFSYTSYSYVGYLIGAIVAGPYYFDSAPEDKKRMISFDVTDNFHYITEGSSGDVGIGRFDAWKNPSTVGGVTGTITRNFCSSDQNLSIYSPDGDLRYHSSLPIIADDWSEYANGMISEEQMKSARLAAVLNLGAANESEKIWTVKSFAGVPVNEGFPVIREIGDSPSYPVQFKMADFDEKANETQIAALNNAGIDYPSVYVDPAHKELYLFTDNEGYISLNEAVFVNSLVDGTTSSWYDENDQVVTFDTDTPEQYFNGNTVYTYKSTTETKYFCFEEDGSNLNFSQEESASNPSGTDKKCFGYWYKDNADHSNGTPDAYAYAQNWLDNNEGSIVLTSEKIEFAGSIDENGTTVCVDAPDAFKGHYLRLGANDAITSEAGKIDTIAGLCYTSDAYGDDAKFALISDVSANVTKLAFKDVFFNVSGSRGEVGLIEFYESPSLVSDISVLNSTFKSKYYAGAISARMSEIEFIKDITMKNVNVIVNYKQINSDVAGGIAAVVTATNGLSVSNVSLSGVYVECDCWSGTGGVFGRINNANKEISLKNVSVSGTVKGLQPAGLVGYLNTTKTPSSELYANAAYTIENSNFVGTVEGDIISLASGGLVGTIHVATSGETKLKIKDNYVVGDIPLGGNAGYLVSSIDFEDNLDISNINFDVTDNYFYGENTTVAAKGIGAVGTDEYNNLVDDWIDWKASSQAQITGVIARNFRNSVGTLVADGDLQYAPKPIKNGDESYDNGILDVDDMKTARFAAVLNMDGGEWTIKNDLISTLNEGLPIFADNSLSPIYPVSFNLGDFNAKASDEKKSVLQNASDTYPMEYINDYQNGIVLFTDNEGLLASTDVDFVNSLLDENSIWKKTSGTPSLSATTQYRNGKAVYTYSSSPLTQYFCFKEYDTDNTHLYFSQVERDEPLASDGTCFINWFNGSGNDASTFAQNWLDGNNSGSEKRAIYLTTNVNFAGNEPDNSGNTVCVNAPNAFNGKFLELGNGDSFVSQPSERHVTYNVAGLCYTSDADDAEVGFVKVNSEKASFGSVNFSDVFFKLTGSGDTKAGTALYGAKVSSLSSITISNSVFEAKYAGAITGYVQIAADPDLLSTINYHAHVEKINLSGVTVNGYYAGAAIGYATADYVDVSDLMDYNTVVVNSTHYGGGFFGYLTNVTEINFKKCTTTGSVDGKYVGGLVGYLGVYRGGEVTIEKTKVSADITTLCDGNGTYCSAGSLVGNFDWIANGSDEIYLHINHNYSVGNIKKTGAGGESAYIGYLLGYLVKGRTNIQYNITDNYHYGTDDELAKFGIGSYTTESSVWNNPAMNSSRSGFIARNFRNAIDGSLAADGDLYYDAKPVHHYDAATNTTESYYNGIIPVKQMKNRRFAAVLNTDEANWSVSPGYYNDMPVFATSSMKPIYPVSFDLDAFYAKAADANKKILKDSVAAGLRQFDAIDAEHKGIVLYTDNTGAIETADAEFVLSLLATDDSWSNSTSEFSSSATYTNGNTVYGYKSPTVPIEKQFCVTENGDKLGFGQYDNSELPTDATCYKYWFNENASVGSTYKDAYSHITDWLSNNPSGVLNVNTDIRFAGWTFNEATNEVVCNDGNYTDGNDAFKGKMISLGEEQTINAGGSGLANMTGYKVITGLCYVGGSRENQVGFIRNMNGTLRQLAFDSAYFKSDVENSVVGIIVSGSGTINSVNLSNFINPQNPINMGPGASIKVTNSEFRGAIVGAVFGRGGLILKDAIVENVKVYGQKYAGGLVGYSENALDIEFAAVHADVRVSGSSAYAGGLVGYLNNADTDNPTTIVINANYTIGDVTGITSSTLGYLVGGVNDVAGFDLNLKSNYHYGTNDEGAEQGIGSLTAVQWNNNVGISHNIRNAVGSLVAGTLYYATDKPVLSTTTFYRNGIISNEQMKSRFMAAVLNLNGKNWTEKESVNDGLPRFAAGVNKAILPVIFDVESYENLADDAHKGILQDSVAAGYRQYETYGSGNNVLKVLILYTDANGNLISDDVAFVNSLLGEDNYWYSSKNNKREFVNTSTVYSDGSEIYLYREGVRIYIVNHFCDDDGNGRCEPGTEKLVEDLLADPQNGSRYAYGLAPVDKFVSPITTSLVPPLMQTDEFGNSGYILPSFYEINAKDQSGAPETGALNITSFENMPDDIISLDYSNSYNDTIHLYYVSDLAFSANEIKVSNGGNNVSLAVSSFGRGADGSWSEPLLKDTIYPESLNNMWMPVPLALTVEPLDFGYTFNSWAFEFGYSARQGTRVTRVMDHYVVSPATFAADYTSRAWKLLGLSVNDTIYLDSIYVGMQSLAGSGITWDDFYININPSATANNYNVTFDLDSKVHKDSLVVFGNSWDFGNSGDFAKEMSLDAEKRNFPKAYIYSASTGKFYPLAWSHKTQDQFDFEQEKIYNVAFTELTSPLLENAANGDVSVTDVTIYPINAVGRTEVAYGRSQSYPWIDEFDASPIYVVAVDDDGNEVTNADAYHGHIVLSQTRGNVTLQQESRFNSSSDLYHSLYVPASASDDTLTFNVSAKAEPGYAMVLKGYEHNWDTAPADEDWGLNVATDTVLKYSTANMGPSKFTVQFIPHIYNLEFVIPSDLLDKDIFVANKLVATNKYETDWFSTQDDVTASTVKAPQLYDSYGCRIYWKPDGALHNALDIKEELQYLTPSANGNFVNNELVPDYDNPDCALAQYHRIKVDIDTTKGHLYLVQKLAIPSQTPSLYDSIEITHKLDYENGVPYINVPKVFNSDGNDIGTKLQVQIVAKDGYFFESVCADKYDGSFCEAFHNGDKLDIWDDNRDDGSWHVRFTELNPTYVTYDLSLTRAEDSTKVYLPTGAAPTGTLKIDMDKDSLVLWKPFRTDMCFMGWSEEDATSFDADEDSLYKVFSVNNYHVFSKDDEHPTKLHAIWDACTSVPTTSVVLKNGNSHATLALYQLFGNDTLRHVIPSVTAASGIVLESSSYTDASGAVRTGYDFYLDEVNTKPEFGYTLENYTLSYSYEPVDGSASVGPVAVDKNADESWHVEEIAGETVAYTFDAATSLNKFDLVFHVNMDSLVYVVKGENLDNLHKSIENVTVDANIEFPTVDRVGACFNGWNIAPDPDSTNGYVNLDFLQFYVLQHIPLADVTVNTVDGNGDPIQKIVYNLYPVWSAVGTGNCSENTYTVSTNVPVSQGQFVIYQVVDGDSVKRVVNKETPVELLKNYNIHYRVKFEPAFGYTLAANARDTVHYGVGNNAIARHIANDSIYHFNDSTGASVASLAVSGLSANAYDFAFDANASGNVFYGDSWQLYIDQNASENNGVITLRIPYSDALPQALYRAGNCLEGYTLDKDDDTDGLYNAVTQTLVDKIAARNITGAATLYAKWNTGACANQTVYTITSSDADKGLLKLSRKFDLNGTDSTTARVYSVPAAGLQVPSNGDVSFTGMSFDVATGETLVWDEASAFSSKTDAVTSTWNDITGLFTVTGDVSVKAPLLTNTYTFVYNANADGENTFYVGNFTKEKEYVLDDVTQSVPLYSGDDLTRTDKCFEFWSFDKDATSGFTSFDADLLRLIQQREENSLQVDTLYAIWDDNSCSLPSTFKVVSGMGEKGSFKLYQVNGSSADDTLWYDVGTATSDIPAVAGIKLGVKFIASSPAYSFGDEIVGVNADDESNVLFTLDNGTATAVHGELFSVAANQKNVKLSVVNTANMLHFAFNENSEGLASLPYFGDDWEGLINSASFKVDANDGNWIVSKKYDVSMTSAQKKFPMALYSDDACLSGYAFSATGTTAYTELEDAVVTEYYRGSYSSANPMVLYAVWDTYCVVSGTNVNFAGTDKGQYRFARKFALGAASTDSTPERVYTFAAANVSLPSVNGDISFTDWSFITQSGAGVIVDTDSAIAYRKDAISDWTVAAQGSLFNVTDDVKYVNVPLLKNSYTFTYDKNWTEARDVFFSASKLNDATYTIDDVSESVALQPTTVMGRTDACLTGWALDAAGSMVIDAFDAAALRKLDSLDAEGEDISTLYAVWADAGTDCTPAVFNVTTETLSEQGQFEVYQVVGTGSNDTLWYNVAPGENGGIVIPAVEDLPLGIKFTTASPAYTFDGNVAITETGVAPRTLTNGDTIYVAAAQKNISLSVDANAVSYKLAFYENAGGSDEKKSFFGDSFENFMTATSFSGEDDDGNWTVTANYSVNSLDKSFPMAMYRDGYCMQGFTFVDGDNTDGLYSEFNDEFIAAFARLNKDPATTTTLYAYWAECTDGVTVKLVDTDKGSYKFTRTFDIGNSTVERVYEASTDNFKIPSVNNDVSFTDVEFVMGNTSGYILDTQNKIQVKGDDATAIWTDYTAGDKLTVDGDVDSIKAPVLKSTYRFAYDRNFADGKDVFYSPDMKFSELYTIADDTQSKNLQSFEVMARTDACLIGWALDADGNREVGLFDIETLRTLNALEAEGEDISTLYAVWKSAEAGVCEPKTFKVVSGMDDAKGTFQAYRVLDSDTTWYDIGANGLEFPTLEGMALGFKFTGASTYSFGTEITVSDGVDTRTVTNGDTILVAAAQNNLTLTMDGNAVKFYFAFNENTSSIANSNANAPVNVFFGDSWQDLMTAESFKTDATTGDWMVTTDYTVESANKNFPMALYRDDGNCLQGYAFSDNGYATYTELDDIVIAEYNRSTIPHGRYNPMVLYAIWTPCALAGTVVHLADTDKGSYTFSRTFSLGNTTTPAREYVVSSADFRVPSDDISFNSVAFDVTATDVILDNAAIAVKGVGSANTWTDYTVGDMLTAGSNLGSVKAPLLKNSYKFAYDKNWDNASEVFYSPSMVDAATYTINDVSESKSLQSFEVMARTDACLTGWALDAAGNNVIDAFGVEALRTLAFATNVDTLYAVWTAKGTGCTPKTFTVKSAMPTAQGSFKAYRVLGTDTTWYDVGANGLEIPTLEGMELGVTFTAASPAYTFGNNVSIDVGGTAPLSIANGKTFEVAAAQKNAKLSVTSDAVDYTVAFNSNDKGAAYFGDSWSSLISDATFSTDADDNWIVTATYSMNSSDKSFPTAMYRDGYCLQGYTFTADDKTEGLFSELDDGFVAKFAELGLASPVTLYAYWDACSATGATVKLTDADKGSYKFTRTFDLGDSKVAERTYTIAAANYTIPSNNDVSFNSVAFEVKSGVNYILDTEAKYAYRNASTWTEIDGLFTVDSDVDSIKAPILKSSYKFIYDKNYNNGKAVFYSPSKVDAATYTIADISQSKSLQSLKVMARTDACLTGWALDPAGNALIGEFDGEALRVINALEAVGEDVSKLYAVWTAKGSGCAPKTFSVTSGMPASQGSFELYRVYASETTWYDVGSNGVEIPTLAGMMLGVKFTAASPAYTFGPNVAGEDASGNRLFNVVNGKTFEVAAAQKSFKLNVNSDAVEYVFAFNENDEGAAYFGDSWNALISDATFSTDANSNWIVKVGYSVNSADKKFPTAMYRDGYCLQGYTFAANDKTDGVYTELDDAFISKFAALGKTSPATLYAYWGTCTSSGVTVKLAYTDKGTYKFTRTFDLGGGKSAERTYEVATANYTIPSNNDVSFNSVAFDVNSGVNYILDTEAKFTYRKASTWTEIDGVFAVDSEVDSIKAPILKNSYRFVYDKNYNNSKAVFYSPDMIYSATYALESVSQSRSLQTFDVMARTDACLTGWALDPAGNAMIGEFDGEALRVINALEAVGEDVSKLYAVWTAKGSGCAPKTFSVTSGMPASQGSFELYRVYASETTWYDVGSNGVEIPTLAGMMLGVKFTAASPAYTFGPNVAGEDASGNRLFNVVNGKTFEVVAAQKNVKLSVTSDVVTYTFAFNANAGKASVFSGADFMTTGKFVIGDTLPMNLYRTDAKLVGWSFEPLTGAVTGKVFTKLNDEFVNAFESRAKADTLYAVWAVEQARKTYEIKITNLVEEGSFELKNASGVYTVKPGETLTVPAETDVTFAVTFKPNAYNRMEYSSIEVLDAKSGKLLKTVNAGDTYNFATDVSLRAVGKFKPVQFALDANAGTNKVFFGDAFREFSWTANAFEEVLPTELYRTDAVLVGWSMNKNSTKGSRTYDETLANAYDAFATSQGNEGKLPVLYAVWQKQSVKTVTVKPDSAKKGKLTLTQFVEKSSFAHEVPAAGLKVPQTAEGLIFQAHFDVNESWSLNAKTPLVWTTAASKDSTANDAFKVVKADVTVKVLAVYKEFHIVFETTTKDTLFYGEDWMNDGDFASTEEKTATEFPTMVYNTDSCLAGWSLKIGSTSYTNLQDSLIRDLYAAYPNINSSTDVKLYAQWTDKVEDCAARIARVGVEQLHGDVQLVENVDRANLVHSFNKNGSMLVPAEIESDNWTVSTKPDSSFVLDSLVVLRDGKKEGVLHEGDHLPTNMENVVLKAYFGKANKTPIEIVDRSFAQSGNAVRVGFKTSAFEVTRAVSARVQITDEKGVLVLDSLLGDSVVSAFADEVVMRVSKPGTYRMLLAFSDSKESAEYSEEFSVKTQIASLEPERWQMISLVAVDTSAIVWDGNSHFYWWDESYCGEFWQYKTFDRGDEIIGTRGVWYSTLNGSSLSLKADIEDDGKDIVWELDSIGSGWNLVANPHGWSVNLFGENGNVRKDVDEQAEVSFWRYNAETNDYEEAETIGPYEAVWAKTSMKRQWKVSAKPTFTISNATENDALQKRTLAKATTKDRWTLQAVLSDDNGRRDAWNIIGVGRDPFVAEEPPTSFGDHVTLSILEGKHGLAKSIKDSDSEMEWTMALSATGDRAGYLSFVGIKDINAFGYHVYVTIDGNTTEMKEGSPLQVSLSTKQKTATVRVERSAIVVAQKSGLKSLRSAKLGNQLHVSFEVPDELVDESTRVELLTAKGGVVATATARSMFGTNKVAMDAPKNGVYILRVRVGSAQLTQRILVK